MILTGKAKEAFEKWFDDYSQKHHQKEWLDYDLYLDEVYLPDELMNALIIEWLDSVGICTDSQPYLEIDKTNRTPNVFFFPNVIDLTNIENNYVGDENYLNRHQAAEKAIEKANEIYNERGN